MAKYKPLKSSVRSTKSKARLMFEAQQKKIKQYLSMSASKSAATKKTAPEKNKARSNSIPISDRATKVIPIKQTNNFVQQLPDTPLSRKGLSLKSLIRTTPNLMKANSEEVVIKTLVRKKTKSGLPAVEAIAYSVSPFIPNKTIRNHKLYIIGLDSQSDPISKQRRVLVSCACENYVYTWEYANALHGAAKLVYGNGESPDFTNPQRLPGLCKHAYALSKELIKKGW